MSSDGTRFNLRFLLDSRPDCSKARRLGRPAANPRPVGSETGELVGRWRRHDSWWVSKVFHVNSDFISSFPFRSISWEAERLGRGDGRHLGSAADEEPAVRGQRLRQVGAGADCQSGVQRKVARAAVGQSELPGQVGTTQDPESRLLRGQQSVLALDVDCKSASRPSEALFVQWFVSSFSLRSASSCGRWAATFCSTTSSSPTTRTTRRSGPSKLMISNENI